MEMKRETGDDEGGGEGTRNGGKGIVAARGESDEGNEKEAFTAFVRIRVGAARRDVGHGKKYDQRERARTGGRGQQGRVICANRLINSPPTRIARSFRLEI